MHAKSPTFSEEHLIKNCVWKEVSPYTFLRREKSFSTSKRAVWATGPQCSGFTQGLWALPETAWHPGCPLLLLLRLQEKAI